MFYEMIVRVWNINLWLLISNYLSDKCSRVLSYIKAKDTKMKKVLTLE